MFWLQTWIVRIGPNKLSGCGGKRATLSFNWRMWDSGLFFWWPSDRMTAKIHNVSSCRSVVIFVSSLIGIGEGMKNWFVVCLKHGTLWHCSRKISKNSFDNIPVIHRWPMHELGQLVDEKGDIWRDHEDSQRQLYILLDHPKQLQKIMWGLS